jgi:peptidoglycan hydrolase-like protein with peptidoglycan-binding domain
VSRRLLQASIGAVCFALALAAPTARAITAEQFAALEPDKALALPALEAVDLFGWTREEYLFVLENALIDLRYLYRTPSGRPSPQLTAAIKAFQRDIGHPATGTLLLGELFELMQSGNEFWQAPINPGSDSLSRQGDVVTAQGTWVAPGALEPNPIHTSSIRCYRAASVCSVVTARVMTDIQPGGWYHVPGMDLALETRDLALTQWSDERVVAEEQSGPCVVYRLSVDLRGGPITLAREPTGAGQCSAAIAPARTYTLSSGYEMAARYWGDWRNRMHKVRSSAFQKLVQQIQAKRKKPLAGERSSP